MVKRTSAQAAETRETILRVAGELFAERGYQATSIADIASAAGATKGAVFHHFKSKDELFVEIWRQLQLDMDADARTAALAALDPADPFKAFLAGCRIYLDWASRPEYQRIVLLDGPSVLGLARWHEMEFEVGRASLVAGTKFIAAQGHFPKSLAVPAALMLQASINAAAFALTDGKLGITREQYLDTFERLLRGLR
ncbi:MAG: hypothetical protein C0421_03380 [Hyphomonas sp.]|jgi:AcrR family transcriptional regulator|uniref:TetR family transcriptional regulator n=1 Tax=Hyphomonas sp. TaxID=87 RepID=UPI0025C14526|nr:TetR family transcriptional regulator [Hyphomonas sp.]MBA4337869.1 hypothetical protein [Hyphomonas sp.]